MHLRSVILYVAGPYGSYGTIEENIKIATERAQELWNAGFTVICPHTNTGHFKNEDDGGIPELEYLEGYLHIVPRCDGIVLLPNWEKSSGAVKENNLAHTLGLPVFGAAGYTIPNIKEYFLNKIAIEKIKAV